ncbi:LuxR C-terminal-related transcriptional regulator [Rubripirellula reticaptiva]|uniref:Oxygen regulatory protein NreC n=1 Tax=Rubripirellula reticaptiva TaxID=2528013 RepID=A0A5C6EKW9_9BACT|nr:response regulator transcription factor [Rubripirellula reticaptiva]TWU48246.1 Oxygen regulatory protein NreC [Rubripirellula reticaptiva]
MPIRILVVDPHEITRAGIGLACQSREDLKIVGEVDSIDEAVLLTPETNPNVVVMDPRSCAGDGLEELLRYRNAFPAIKILAFTGNENPAFAKDVVECGVDGFLIKDASADELCWAIRTIHAGRIFISHSHHGVSSPQHEKTVDSNIQKRDANALEHPNHLAMENNPDAQIDLSTREREVLALIADGMTNKQAAAKLFLSVKTVETYRARVMRKHQLKDRSDLVRFAKRHASKTLELQPTG